MENKLWTRQANINLLLTLSKLLLSVWIMTLTCFVAAQNAPLRYVAYPADSLQNITPDQFFQNTLGLKAPNSFTEINIYNTVNSNYKLNTIKL
ncbi:MAG: hypothetical protein LBL18_02120 [Bacteroidales bacterium]|jgi:hypothetical protein|nr:hypothetical protein [Bacteroidales bacterium]